MVEGGATTETFGAEVCRTVDAVVTGHRIVLTPAIVCLAAVIGAYVAIITIEGNIRACSAVDVTDTDRACIFVRTIVVGLTPTNGLIGAFTVVAVRIAIVVVVDTICAFACFL